MTQSSYFQPTPTLNVERLNELADFIDGTKRIQWDSNNGNPVCAAVRKPHKWFNMSTWFRKVTRKNRAGETVDCGTVGCIAGWANTLYGNGAPGQWQERGRELLGLTYDQADELFFARDIKRKSLLSPHRAAKVLRRLAKTGQVNWRVR
jgi:hypothetical protein